MKFVVQHTKSMLEIDVVTAITTYIMAMQNMMNTHFSNMALGKQPIQVNSVQQPPCGANRDTVNFVGNTKIEECQKKLWELIQPKLEK